MERLGQERSASTSPIVKERNLGIDILRILSVYYVLILHVLGCGGVLGATEKGTLQYYICWGLEMWTFCAVNIFAMISGYVGYTAEPKRVNYANYLVTWLQVVFYGVCFSVLFFILRPELVTRTAFLKTFFPVASGAHWYFTAYTGLFLLTPLINAAVRQFSRRYLKGLLLVIFLIFSLYDSIADRFNFLNGYSVAWLCILYLIGAIIKKCEIGKNLTVTKALICIAACNLISWVWCLTVSTYYLLDVKISETLAHSYLFPPHLISAIMYIIIFSRIKVSSRFTRVIRFGAAGVFGVYLANTNDYLWFHVWPGLFSRLAYWSVPRMLLCIFAFSIVFLVVFLCVDYLRQKLFQILHIRQLANIATDVAIRFIDIAVEKLFS